MKTELPKNVAENIENFTGRTWLLSTLLEWFENSSDRMFILTGEPGVGKSMVMAWLMGTGSLPVDLKTKTQLERIRTWVKAAHFCISASGSTAPKAFAKNIAEQLTLHVKGFGDALVATLSEHVQISTEQHVGEVKPGGSVTGVYISRLDLGSLGDELSFDRTFRDPLKKLYKDGYDEPMVLLVDSLDEALTYTGSINVVRLLTKLSDLPEQVYILATTRPDPRALKHFRDIKPFDLIIDAPQSSDDVLSYAKERLDGTRPNELAEKVAQAAEGNFLYAHFVLSDLLQLPQAVINVDEIQLPKGLGGLYHKFLNRELGSDEDKWYQTFKPLLGLIAVAQGEGLTGEQLKQIIGKNMEQTLRQSKQYLQGSLPNGPFRPFHKSFADFLLEDDENIDYPVDAKDMNLQIANYYWNTYHEKWQSCDPYGLQHIVNHIQAILEMENKIQAQKEQRAMLYEVVLNKEFQYARRDQCGDISGTLTDLRTAIGIALENDDLLPALRCIASYRDRIRTESITKAIFDSVSDGIFNLALEKGNQYQMVFSPFGWWSHVLQLYIAWEAAETGNIEATLQAIANVERLSWNPAEDLCNALLVRCARVLSQKKGNERSAGSWLEELIPNCDSDFLLSTFRQAQVLKSDLEKQDLLSDLDRRLRELEQLVAGGDPEAVSMVPFINEEIMADRAANLKDLLVKLAADPEGQERIDRVLEPVLTNPYPRYRDIALVALGLAIVAIPDPLLVRMRLKKILSTALDYEGVSFTFDLPAIFLAEVKQRKQQSIELSEYLDKAIKSKDRWGTSMRARSAHSAGLFWQGEKAKALNELKEVSQLESGFAGYATVTQLSLANRCCEFGFSEQIFDPIWGSEKNAPLLERAKEQADLVRDQEFRQERIKIVEDYKNWLVDPVPDLNGALKKLSTMPNDDFRNAYIAYLSAQWSRPDNRDEEGLKALVPMVLGDGTTLDSVLGRLFGPRIKIFSKDDLYEATKVCAKQLTTARPWKLGQWR